MYEFQPINQLLCFVVDRTGAVVWFSERQSWWRVEVARQRFKTAF